MTNRRDFVSKTIGAVLAALVLPVRALASHSFSLPRPFVKLGVSDILRASFPAVKAELLKSGEWTNDRLNALSTFQALGPIAMYKGKKYQIEEVSVPAVWSDTDEHDGTEANRIAFVKTMLENLLWTHDDLLEGHLKPGYRLVASDRYHHWLSDIVKTPTETNGRYSYYVKLYTAFVQVPL